MRCVVDPSMTMRGPVRRPLFGDRARETRATWSAAEDATWEDDDDDDDDDETTVRRPGGGGTVAAAAKGGSTLQTTTTCCSEEEEEEEEDAGRETSGRRAPSRPARPRPLAVLTIDTERRVYHHHHHHRGQGAHALGDTTTIPNSSSSSNSARELVDAEVSRECELYLGAQRARRTTKGSGYMRQCCALFGASMVGVVIWPQYSHKYYVSWAVGFASFFSMLPSVLPSDNTKIDRMLYVCACNGCVAVLVCATMLMKKLKQAFDGSRDPLTDAKYAACEPFAFCAWNVAFWLFMAALCVSVTFVFVDSITRRLAPTEALNRFWRWAGRFWVAVGLVCLVNTKFTLYAASRGGRRGDAYRAPSVWNVIIALEQISIGLACSSKKFKLWTWSLAAKHSGIAERRLPSEAAESAARGKIKKPSSSSSSSASGSSTFHALSFGGSNTSGMMTTTTTLSTTTAAAAAAKEGGTTTQEAAVPLSILSLSSSGGPLTPPASAASSSSSSSRRRRFLFDPLEDETKHYGGDDAGEAKSPPSFGDEAKHALESQRPFHSPATSASSRPFVVASRTTTTTTTARGLFAAGGHRGRPVSGKDGSAPYHPRLAAGVGSLGTGGAPPPRSALAAGGDHRHAGRGEPRRSPTRADHAPPRWGSLSSSGGAAGGGGSPHLGGGPFSPDSR